MKTILISSSDFDSTTNSVIEWLSHFGLKWFRFSEKSKIELQRFSLGNLENNLVTTNRQNTNTTNFTHSTIC